MIGFFDSGSGGLTILDAVHQEMPDMPLVYLGDHARAPYGHRSSEDIVAFTREGVDRLYKEGADLVILACNTAAAIALRSLQQNWLPHHWPDKRLLGVLVPMVEGVTGVSWRAGTRCNPSATHGHVMLFATRRTIESGAYAEEVLKRAPRLSLSQVACPGLVDALEGGAPEAAIDGLIKGFVETASRAHGLPDKVILGCTHFPLVRALFEKHLGPDVMIYDQPNLVKIALKDYISRHNLAFKGSGVKLISTQQYPVPQDRFPGLPLFNEK